jgi:predicted ATPase with chaperone activity
MMTIHQFDLFGTGTPLFDHAHRAPAAPAALFAKQLEPEAPAACTMLAIAAQARDAAFCLSTIAGREVAKRAIEIAVTGEHALALIGAPTMLAIAAQNLAGHLRIDLDLSTPATAADMAEPWPALAAEEYEGQVDACDGETTATILARCVATRQRMAAHPSSLPLDDDRAQSLLDQATAAMQLDAPAVAHVLDVANTLAHMAGRDQIGRIHLAEALSYRVRRPVQ